MRYLIVLLMVSLSFSRSILVLKCVDSKIDDLVRTLEIHSSDFQIEVVENPTLGEAMWRIAKLSKDDFKVLIFMGEVLNSTYLKLSDTNPDYLEESALDLRSLDLGQRSLILIFTDSSLDPRSLRRMGWKGENIIVLKFDDMRYLIEGLKESADENEDGYVSIFEIANYLSGRTYAFVSEDWKISSTTTKISLMAFKRISKLFKSGNLKMEDALTITRAILLEDESALLFGIGKMNVADLLSKLKGR